MIDRRVKDWLKEEYGWKDARRCGEYGLQFGDRKDVSVSNAHRICCLPCLQLLSRMR